MKIAVCSDLHLEFGDITLKNTEGADVLVLSGDIAIAQIMHDHTETPHFIRSAEMGTLGPSQKLSLQFREFFKRCSFEFPHVVYIAGNHEFYDGKWPLGIQYLRDECAKFTNVHFLEMDFVKIQDITFVGGTLWTNMNKGDPLTLHSVQGMMNDFQVIRNNDKGYRKLSPADVALHHRKTVEYIQSVIENKSDEKFVVVGHMAPSTMSIPDEYRGDTLMNGAYVSDLSDFILDHPQIKLWTHGHTHDVFDYMIGDTRVICNPRGYVGYEKRANEFELKFVEV